MQRGHWKPIDAPPTTLLETLKPKCIGYPLSDAQILQLLANLSQGEAHDRVRFAFSPVPSTGSVLRSCATSPKDGAEGSELWTMHQKSMGVSPLRSGECMSRLSLEHHTSGF